MNFTELVQQRRSVRRYCSRSVSREDILQCLEAARLAPSACNSQPWHFMVVDDPVMKTRISEKIFSGIYSMNQFAQDAPVLVAVVAEKQKALAVIGGQIRDTRYYLIDLGIACEHFVLKAQELGIGSCWIGWFDEGALKRELKLSGNKKIDIVLALGYPAEDKIVLKNRKTLDQISSFNHDSIKST